MSSWGPGPLDSDAAEDLLDLLEPLTGERRSDTLMDVLREETTGGETADQALVLAAAAIVAANIDPALWHEWNEDPEDPQVFIDRTSLQGLREAAMSPSRRGRDACNNKGFLRNAPNETVRQGVVDGRVWHLQHEIDTFRSNIDKIWGAGC